MFSLIRRLHVCLALLVALAACALVEGCGVSQANPIGNFELAVDTVTAQPVISQSTGSVWISGWTADYQTNTVSSVHVLVDGVFVGDATLGISRPDVAAYFHNPAWANTGYQFVLPASGLTEGPHQVTTTATDSLKLSTTFGPRTITITP
jgi:hypothetical protein